MRVESMLQRLADRQLSSTRLVSTIYEKPVIAPGQRTPIAVILRSCSSGAQDDCPLGCTPLEVLERIRVLLRAAALNALTQVEHAQRPLIDDRYFPGFAANLHRRAVRDRSRRGAQLDRGNAMLARQAGAVREHAAGLDDEPLDQRKNRGPAWIRRIADQYVTLLDAVDLRNIRHHARSAGREPATHGDEGLLTERRVGFQNPRPSTGRHGYRFEQLADPLTRGLEPRRIGVIDLIGDGEKTRGKASLATNSR